MKTFKEQVQEAYGRRHDAYTRDYHSSISGMGRHKREDDEYHNGPDLVRHTYKFKVSKDGGEHHERSITSPPTTRAKHELEHIARHHLEKQGYKIHEEAAQLDEISDKTLMSYAQKVHDDSLKHDKDPTKRSPEKRNKSVMGFSRALNKLESRPHNEEAACPVCKKDPCECDDSHGFVKEDSINELSSDLLARYKEKAGMAATAADKAKKYDLGHKRFKGIMKATFKQFANDAKK
jgi:hypothetical protein